MSKNEGSNLDFLLFMAQFVLSILIWVLVSLLLANVETSREAAINSGKFPTPNAFIWIPLAVGVLTYATVMIYRGVIKVGYYLLTFSQPQSDEG